MLLGAIIENPVKAHSAGLRTSILISPNFYGNRLLGHHRYISSNVQHSHIIISDSLQSSPCACKVLPLPLRALPNSRHNPALEKKKERFTIVLCTAIQRSPYDVEGSTLRAYPGTYISTYRSRGRLSRGTASTFFIMSTMSNEIKLLSGNSHPLLARLVADRSVPRECLYHKKE